MAAIGYSLLLLVIVIASHLTGKRESVFFALPLLFLELEANFEKYFPYELCGLQQMEFSAKKLITLKKCQMLTAWPKFSLSAGRCAWICEHYYWRKELRS